GRHRVWRAGLTPAAAAARGGGGGGHLPRPPAQRPQLLRGAGDPRTPAPGPAGRGGAVGPRVGACRAAGHGRGGPVGRPRAPGGATPARGRPRPGGPGGSVPAVRTSDMQGAAAIEGGPPVPSVSRALSPSRAADFMQCPMLYRFRVVDQL